jgi:hypothetical protein
MHYGKTEIILCDSYGALGLRAAHKFTIVPLATKRPILQRVLALTQSTESLPASVIRDYPGKLYVDRDSCPAFLLPRGGRP